MSEQPQPVDLPAYADSYGNLLRRGRTDALKRVLGEIVREGLSAPDAITAERISHIVDEVVEVRESALGVTVKGTFHDDLFKLCTSDRSRSLCAGCQTAPCCYYSFMGLSSDEIERLSKYVGLSIDDFIKQRCKRIVVADRGLIYTFKKTNPCEFLGENGYCRVYEARPDVCKTWPLVFDKEREEVTDVVTNYNCNFFFNLLKYEVTVRVFADIMQRKRAATRDERRRSAQKRGDAG